MKTPITVTVCECGAPVTYLKRYGAPGGTVFSCSSMECRHYGMLYEMPLVECRTHLEAALLRPKVNVA